MNEPVFELEERRNVHVKAGKEWALTVRWPDTKHGRRWCIYTWEKEPTEEQAYSVKYVFQRARDVYIDRMRGILSEALREV